MHWEPYDPAWLVELAQSTREDLPWLAEAFSRCTQGAWRSRAYIHFVDPERANQPGADWQFQESVDLVDPNEGHLIVDVLRDRRVGGVEFYDRLFSDAQSK